MGLSGETEARLRAVISLDATLCSIISESAPEHDQNTVLHDALLSVQNFCHAEQVMCS